MFYPGFFLCACERSFETASWSFRLKFWLFSSRGPRKLILSIFSKSKRPLEKQTIPRLVTYLCHLWTRYERKWFFDCGREISISLDFCRHLLLNLLLGEKSWNLNSWNPWVLPLLPNVMRWLLTFSMRNTDTSDKLISFAKLSIIYLSRPFDEHCSSYALFTWLIHATCQELDDNVCVL